jgi:hypothetical protein
VPAGLVGGRVEGLACIIDDEHVTGRGDIERVAVQGIEDLEASSLASAAIWLTAAMRASGSSPPGA